MDILKRAQLFLLVVCALFTFGALSAYGSAVPLPWVSQFDNDAMQLAGGKIYTYSAGTTTPKATWTNATKTATSTNPLILDAYGRVTAYGDGIYKLVIKTASDVVITTIDNVELVSAINPTSLTPTNLTAASATLTLVNIKGGTAAAMTIDSPLVTNGSFTNCYIMTYPVNGSHPVTLSYLNTQLASMTAFNTGALASHIADFDDPHGQTLYQNTLVASAVFTPYVFGATDSFSTGGYLKFQKDGVDLVGNASGTSLDFYYRNGAGALVGPTGSLNVSTTGVWSLINDTYGRLITWTPSTNVIDFGGAELTNFTAPAFSASITAQIASAIAGISIPSATVPVQYYEVSGTDSASTPATISTLTVPSSFTAGYYEVKIMVQPQMTSNVTNGIDMIFTILHGVTTVDTFNAYIPAASRYRNVPTTMSYFLSLSPSDTIKINTSADQSPAPGSTGAAKYRIAIRFMSATRVSP